MCLQEGHEAGFSFDVKYDFACDFERDVVSSMLRQACHIQLSEVPEASETSCSTQNDKT